MTASVNKWSLYQNNCQPLPLDQVSKVLESITSQHSKYHQEPIAMASGVVSLNAGFDIGSENCYIAVAKGGGIEILLNDYSQRSTPAYVALGDRQRDLGVSAKQKQLMNIQSTYYALKRLVGRQYNEVIHGQEDLPFPIEQGEHGDVVIRINHNNEEHVFTATQLLGMLLTKLRQIAENGVDCVINCPNYFTDSQRRALSDAAVIAGLNPLRILPDMTAVAVYYGFYRARSSPDSIVAFVDVGHTTTQVSIVKFKNQPDGSSGMTVLAVECDPNLGGRHFDAILGDHFIKENKLTLNKRSKLRLYAECEKLKKQMSANSNKLPINIECLYEERDFSSSLSRDVFEQLAEGHFRRMESLFRCALEHAHEKYLLSVKPDPVPPTDFKIDAVEVVGGSSRIPAIKRLAKDIFSVDPTTTLNADEAVARGAALVCAMISPTCKVREFHVSDYNMYQVTCKYWFNEDKIQELVLFPKGHVFPFSKKITLNASTLPLMVELEYKTPEGNTASIGQWKVSSVTPVQLNKNKVTMYIKMDSSGLTYLSSASVAIEDTTVNGTAEEPMNVDESPDGQQPKGQQPNGPNTDSSGQPMEAEKKAKSAGPKMKDVQLAVEPLWIRGKLSDDEVNKQKEIEYNLILADRNWKERIDARNELEEYVYEWRGKLEEGKYDMFVEQSEKCTFLSELSTMESWLYQDEESEEPQSKAVYIEKLSVLKKKYSDSIVFRFREYEERESNLERLGKSIQLASKLVESTGQTESDEKVDEKKLGKLLSELDEKRKWFEDVHSYFRTLKLTNNPTISNKDVRDKATQLENATRPIVDELQKLKQAKEAAAKKQPVQGDGQPNEPPNGQEGEKMDVDPNVPPQQTV